MSSLKPQKRGLWNPVSPEITSQCSDWGGEERRVSEVLEVEEVLEKSSGHRGTKKRETCFYQTVLYITTFIYIYCI